MRRTLLSLSILAFGGLVAAAGGCSASSIPIGSDGAPSNNDDSGGAPCGASTCDAGGSADSGSTIDAQPPNDAQPLADGASNDAQPGNLHWYTSCGDPVCQAPESDAGLTEPDGGPCPVVGSTCSTMGDTCGTRNPAIACGANEVCAAHDPKAGTGGCPISSRKFKDDINYLDPAQLEQIHDQTLRIRLASYNYKAPYADPNPRRLGFIIEDDPASPAVDPAHDSIEMYGYLSMVVATMQVQEKEIASLKRQLAETRRARPAK